MCPSLDPHHRPHWRLEGHQNVALVLSVRILSLSKGNLCLNPKVYAETVCYEQSQVPLSNSGQQGHSSPLFDPLFPVLFFHPIASSPYWLCQHCSYPPPLRQNATSSVQLPHVNTTLAIPHSISFPVPSLVHIWAPWSSTVSSTDWRGP